jgi:hypothetical protein
MKPAPMQSLAILRGIATAKPLSSFLPISKIDLFYSLISYSDIKLFNGLFISYSQ